MNNNRHALIIMGALFHGPPAADLVASARAGGVQVVFSGTPQGITPRFPDWVIEPAGADPFSGTNLAAQLRAVGIARVSIAGPETALAAAREQGFEAGMAQVFA